MAQQDTKRPKMKNGLVKRGSTWTYSVQVTDPVTGNKKTVRRGGFATQDEARQAQTAAKAAEQAGPDDTMVEPSEITVGEYLTEWLAGMELQVKATTLRSYRMHVQTHIVPALGTVKLQALSPAMVKAFYAALLKDGRTKRAKDVEPAPEPKTEAEKAAAAKAEAERKPTRKELQPGLSASSVRRVAATLHRALRDAVDEERLTRNPATKVKLPKAEVEEHREMQSWTQAELAKFLESAKGEPATYPLFYLAATTGMRRGELCGLRWKDVDLEKRQVRVQNARVVVGTETRDSAPKRGKRRVVNIDRPCVEALKAQRKAQAAEALALAGAPKSRGYVFAEVDGSPLHPDFVTRAFRTATRKAEVRAIRFHDLRHTHASLLLASGVPVKVVSERLGHTTPAFTMAVYQHVLPGQQEDAADLFAAMLASAAD